MTISAPRQPQQRRPPTSAGASPRRKSGTPTTPRQLLLYRETHRIRPVLDWDPEAGRTFSVCAHDRIRLYRRGGGFLHDKLIIKALAAIERGEGINW